MGRHRGKTFLFQFVNRTSQLFNNSFCRKIWANPGLFLYVSSIFWTTKYHFQQKNWKADPNPGQQNVRPMDFGSLPPPFIHDSSKCPFQQFLYEWWGHKFLCVIHPDSLTSILKLFCLSNVFGKFLRRRKYPLPRVRPSFVICKKTVYGSRDIGQNDIQTSRAR